MVKFKRLFKSVLFLFVLFIPSITFAQRWSTKAPIPVGLKNFTISSVNGKLYALGGRSSSGLSKAVYEYDPTTDSWTSKSPLPNTYPIIKSVAINDKIYAIGERAGIIYILEYDPSLDTWTIRSGTTSGRFDFYSAAAANDKIYVFGAWINQQPLGIVEEYDPSTDIWTLKTSMPTPRVSSAAVTYNGKIYVVGGLNKSGLLNTVEVYDPSLDSWSTKPQMVTARRSLEVQIVEDKLFAISGHSGVTVDNVVEEFNLLTESWAQSDSILTPRERFASGVINDRIYAVGGQDATLLATNEVFNSAQPFAPAGLTALAGDQRVDLLWNKNSESDIFEYILYRSLTDGFNPTPADSIGRTPPSDTTFADTTVLNYNNYYYKVAAVDTNFNVSEFSNQVRAFPRDPVPPATPQNLTALPLNKQVLLNWSANSEPDLKLYTIYRSLTSGFTPTSSDSIDIMVKPDSAYMDVTVINNVTYYYKISAVDSSLNESGFSNEASATPADTSAPSAPQNLVATGLNESIRLEWNLSPESDVLQYNIYRSQTDGFSPLPSDSISFVSAADSVYADSAVTVGLQYFYLVSALDTSRNESAFSNQAAAVPIDTVAPATPQNVIVTDGDRFLDVSWSSNTEPDVDHYVIYRSTTNGFTPTSSDSLTLVSFPDSTYRDSLVTVDTTYYYRISAVDTAFNESGFSLQDSGTPFDITAPAAPQNLIASDGPGIVSLKWSANTEPDLLQYTIYRSTTQGFPPLPSDSLSRVFPPDTTYVDSAVTVNVTYYYVISAVDSFNQESNFSNEDSATPFDPVPPAAPQNLIATGGNSTVSLVWDQNTEPDLLQYVIYRNLTSGFSPTSSDSVGVVLSSDTTFTDTGVFNGQTYYYQIAATDSVLNYSGFSNEASATPTALTSYPWQTKTSMPTGRSKPVSGALNGKIYTVAGEDGGGGNVSTDVLEEYDPATDTWATKAAMPKKRIAPGGDVLNNLLYVVGGDDGTNKAKNELFSYNAASDSWTQLDKLNDKRRDLTATAVNNKLYAIGGRHENGTIYSSVEEYDLGTGVWTNKFPMPTARWGHGSAAVNGKIYVFGGDNGSLLSTVEEFDPAANTWTTKASMPEARRNISANTIAGRIYIIGGENASGYIDSVNVYDPQTDSWFIADSMITVRAEHSTAVLDDIKLYAIGGYDGATRLTTNEEYDPPPWHPLNPAASIEVAQVTLSWAPNIEPDLDYYVVYRSLTDAFTPTVDDIIGRTSAPDTTFSDEDISTGTTYYYRISAFDTLGQESKAFSVQVSVTTSNFGLALGIIDTLVTNSDTLTVPLILQGSFDEANIRSYQFTISFDSTQLNGIEIDTTGFGFSSSAIFFTNILPGAMKFAAIFPDTLSGSNKTMNLKIEVDMDARRDTTRLLITDSFFNEGIPILDLSTTSIRIKPRYGDVSGNKTISSFDASLVLQNAVSLVDFSTGRSEKADVTYNGAVTALDAFYILLRATGSISSFPVEDSLFSKISVGLNRDIVVNVDRTFDETVGELDVQIRTHSVESISSLYLELDVNNGLVNYSGIELPEAYAHYMHAVNFDNGTLKLALIGIPPVDSDGAVVTIKFSAPDGRKDILSGNSVKIVTLEINDVNVAKDVVENNQDNIPKTFALEQNYPNPFNPVTTIKYQLPKSSHVILKIYNILGQEVRKLINEEKPSGYYTLRWDGRNNFGISVAGGVYIYQLRAGNHVLTKRMVLVK